MKIVFSWDDGALEDKKLFELHKKYQFPGMFFVPNYNSEGRDVLTPEDISKADASVISFGGHTRDHVYLTDIDINEVHTQIKDNLEYLGQITGKKIKHFCLPGGKYNDEILKIAFSECETVRTADTMNFHNTQRLIKSTIHVYPRGVKSLVGNALRNREFMLAAKILFLYRKKDYFSTIREIIKSKINDDKATVIIWGHSWEIEELNLWKELEDLFLFIKEEGIQVIKYNDILKF